MVVETEHIQAGEKPIAKLFGEDHLYKIPRFQRPISWDKSNFEELVDDIVSAFENQRKDREPLVNENGSPKIEILEDYEPYFLGSIILNRKKQIDRFQIIDGQQRLISLSILISVIRDLIDEEWDIDSQWPEDLQGFVYEEGNLARGKEETIRLKVREQESEFFHSNVLERKATLGVDEKSNDGLSEPKKRIIDAINIFKSYLKDWEEQGGNPIELATFLAQRVLLVKISTSSLESAYRLFNVTNARGTPLTNADLMKNINLGAIDKQERDDYANIWEEIELKLGNEELERLIGFMRHIILKDKNRSTIHEEFKNKVFEEDPNFRGKEFIKSMENVYKTYRNRILDPNIDSKDSRKNVYYHNLVSLMRNVYPSDEWIIALIRFDREFSDPDGLYDFLIKLERQLSLQWLTGVTRNHRYSFVYEILEEIENHSDVSEILSLDKLNSLPDGKEKDFKESLDVTNFYRKGNYQWPKYLLLRLDLERHDNTTLKMDYGDSVTIEHILPQKVKHDYWLNRFDEKEFRERWTDRLGNLVPLQGSKNYKASNKPFDEKYEEYFKKKSSDLSLTNDLKKYEEWTPSLLEKRHKKMKEEAVKIFLKY